ncbi:FtsX-like permease family protein [Azovibrio restrictus]|uniref:ABC transporter permease n=1 Tax=Azovibrio restrictus TaxID=146938 RepID=UPI0026EFCB36|nr:FtsX-like permease family protein [Azovibrio restrictus]
MSALLRIALLSAWNRRLTLGLTLLSIALAVTLLLGVERSRVAARTSFAQSVSGTDLILGARTSPVQLLLYSVFRMGGATNNIGWDSYQDVTRHPAVAWTIPIALGDSHRGFPVIGTNDAYFEHFRYGRGRALELAEGRPFAGIFETVLGAEVARRLGYRLGESITLSHGSGELKVAEHGDKPFTVVGILAPTGTPVDHSVHVSLEAIEAIHLDWQGGAPMPGVQIAAEHVQKFDLSPKTLTAALIGLKNRAAVFKVQRHINGYPDEPLLAVLPGVALDELWRVVALVEQALIGISVLVVAVGLAGLVAVILASLGERRRELAVLRSVGAGPRHILALLALEGGAVTLAGMGLGLLLLKLLAWTAGPLLEARLGLSLAIQGVTLAELKLLGAVALTGLAASLLPAVLAYRRALSDGLTPRL